MEPVTVTIEDARKALGIGLTKTYELISSGQLDARKLGRRTLITTESIHRFAQSLSSWHPPT